ncbi:MAG: N-acyl-D-glucosamine 2-epimerase [Chloroflexota bacterium]|nr:MAG: N-acyl-D-glucosamine 2-epimerase [Chloroflexota bacterium]
MNQPSSHIVDETFKLALRQPIEAELIGNILPFWINHTVDRERGGFYGALSNDLHIHNESPRSAVVCARILWTYSSAYRQYRKPEYLAMVRHAYEYLTGPFWDPQYGGVYWQIDSQGMPVMDRKHSYAQAFAIYGLSEYYRAVQEPESLQRVRQLFALLETHASDPVFGGYIEGRNRGWNPLQDMRLSDKEPDCQKSMNTLLHILEGYTNLLRAWRDETLASRLKDLLEIFFRHVIDPRTHHFKLFFDERWNSQEEWVSYGHDIEGSWLLVEAAETLGHPGLLAEAREVAVKMAAAVLAEGVSADGSVIYEIKPDGIRNDDKHWWVQAEGMVGFYNAYQISGDPAFARASMRCWEVIASQFVDRQYGEWYKVLDSQGIPYADHYKVGPWECPYHHSRACFEMLARLL